MKTILSLILLAASLLVSHAEGYFTGVWYCTKAPTPSDKISGYMEVVFYGDGTLDAEIDFNDDIFDEPVGSWHTIGTGIKRAITFTDADGWTYTGIWNTATATVTGNFKSGFGSYKGKFQMTFIDTTAEADAAKSLTAKSASAEQTKTTKAQPK